MKPHRPRPEGALQMAVVGAALLLIGLAIAVFSTTWNPGFTLLAGGMFAVVVSAVMLTRPPGPYSNMGQIVAVGFLAWAAVSTFSAYDVYLAQRSLAGLVGAVAILFGLQFCLTSKEGWRTTVKVTVFLATVASMLAWWPALGRVLAKEELPALVGTFNNPDTFSLIPLTGFFLGMGLLRVQHRQSLMLMVELPILFVSTLATGCRAALVALLVGLGVFVFVLWFFRTEKHRTLIFQVAIPLVAVVIYFPFTGYHAKLASKIKRLVSVQGLQQESLRAGLLVHGIPTALEAPLRGAGPGNFALAYQKHRPDGLEHIDLDSAHNDYFEVMVELGFPGFLLWMLLLYLAVDKAWRCATGGRQPVPSASMLATLWALGAFAFFNFIVYQRATLHLFFFVLGLALSFPSTQRRWLPRVRHVLAMGIFLGCLGGWTIWTGYRIFQVDTLMSRAAQHQRELEWETASRLYDEALLIFPQRADLLLVAAELALKQGTFLASETLRAQAGDYLKAAVEHSPRNRRALTELARWYAENGDFEAAEQFYVRSTEVAPYYKRVALELAAARIRQGRIQDAAKILGDYELLQEHDVSHMQKLEVLLFSLEVARPEESLPLYKGWLENPDSREETLKMLGRITDRAMHEEQLQVAQRIYRFQSQLDRTDVCARFGLAQTEGLLNGEDSERVLLDAMVDITELDREGCMEKAFQRQLELQLKSGQSKLVEKRLEEFVERYPGTSWARVQLSESYESQRQLAKAIRLIESGLERNASDVRLLKRIGDLYCKSGSPQLAVGYYRDALERDPESKEIQEALQNALTSGGGTANRRRADR